MLKSLCCLGMILAAADMAAAPVALRGGIMSHDPLRAESEGLVSRHKAVFSAPPQKTPSEVSVDGPLLGNGDMGVCLGGPPQEQTYYLSKNDFWRLKSQYGEAMPKLFGTLTVSMPGMEGASYRVEQELYAPVTVATFKKEGVVVEQRAWVAATENVLVLELRVRGGSARVEVALVTAESPLSEDRQGADGAVAWVERAFRAGVDIPTAAAAALAIAGTLEPSFTLVPDEAVTLAVALRSGFQGDGFRDAAIADARRALAEAGYVQSLWEEHAAWWADFWAQSYVALGHADLERHYYLSNYVMASCSRDPEFPPGIFGTWLTTNEPGWAGDYHLNYNHMAPYYGLYSSNHLEQADPYHAPILAFMERGRWYAREALGIRGVYYPVGIGPKGIETTRNSVHKSANEKGGLFFGQKSNAAYCVVNLSMRWYRSYDPAYAKKVYPFIREVTQFWEDYLEFEDGRYVVRSDAVHEGSGDNFNPVLTLGLVRNLFETALDMSTVLALDADRHEKWHHILEHLSEFPTQERGGKTIFRYTERGTDWWRDNTLGIQHVYPGGAVGLDSEPELLRVAHNTIDVMNRWHDFNGMNSFFPAAVRVGYDAETIFARLRTYVREGTRPNGFAKDNPHGIENCSIVPNTINEMLCMGHQGVLRFFPVWPKNRPARFANLRAEGAFLCAGALDERVVQYVHILSERGRDCTLANPWPGKAVTLYRDGKQGETLEGARFTFRTKAGELIEAVPERD